MIHRAWATAVACLVAISAASACPFCSVQEPSLGEQLDLSDAVVFVQWTSAVPISAGKEASGSTNFSIVQIVRQPGDELAAGSAITLDRYRAAKPGDLFLLMGTHSDAIEWGAPVAVTQTSFQYITKSPGRETPAAKRLPYFLQYLEHPDELISKDAFSEFAAAPYSDIEPLANQFSSEKLKTWLAKKETNQTRIGFYGMMLGLCGGKEDAAFLKAEIDKPTESYRLGLDGMMAGLVLLTGDDGITVLEQKIRNEKDITDTYAAMQTLRFMWQYARSRVSEDRLRQAMRQLIDHQSFAELAITDLTRWDDWQVMPRLIAIYDSPGHNSAQIKRAIAKFLIALSKKKPSPGDTVLAKYVDEAKSHLADLEARDPKIVKDARKYTF